MRLRPVARLFRGGVRPARGYFSPYPLAAALLCLSAATLLFAQSERGDYTQSNLGALTQPGMRRAQADDAKYSIGSYPLYSPELPAGEGMDLVTQCLACHSTRYILMQPPLSRQQWSDEVNKMVKTYGAEIPEADLPIIINYLAAHFSPETRKR
jgi:hypothetical protein